MSQTQKQIVLEHLRSGRGITQLEATRRYSITRLAPIIHTLIHQDGIPVKKNDKVATKSSRVYAEYYLEDGLLKTDEPPLFSLPDAPVQRTDAMDISDTPLVKGNPPQVGGTEVRGHHVSNPGDNRQILESFKSYCRNFNGKRVEITADWSRQLLKLNRNLPVDSGEDLKSNRAISKKKLEDFKDNFRKGTFLYTNVGIGFDEDGWLCDGQTRLTASVETGVPFFADVSFDLSRDAFAVIDSGLSARKNTDFAYMHGVKEYTAATVSTVSILYRKLKGLGHTEKLSSIQIIEALELFPDVGPSVRMAKLMRVTPGPKSTIAAVHYLASKINKAVADKAFEDLATGAVSDVRDPVLVARNRLISAYNSSGNEFRGAGDKRVRIMLSRMFNYRCSGVKLKSYLLDSGDDWPSGAARNRTDDTSKKAETE